MFSATMTDTFGDWATLLGALATLALFATAVWAGLKAAGGVREQISAQRAIERQRRVFDHQSTLNSREFIELSAEAADVIEMFRTNAAEGEELWKTRMSRLEKMRVLAVLNYYELVATEYNAEVLDRPAADTNLAYAVVVMWRYAKTFLDYLRRDDPAYFDEWKYLWDHSRHEILSTTREPP